MTSVAKANIDTVEDASTSPDTSQPWAELGLKADEYDRIREILGRRPTSAELAMYSVMWSEHCSYKSSKVHLAQFSENTTDEMNAKLLVGIGENAGVVEASPTVSMVWGAGLPALSLLVISLPALATEVMSSPLISGRR